MMFALVLIGCTGSGFEDLVPTVKFERLDVKTVDFTSIGVDFVFDVHNPNPIDVPLSRFDYALSFEGIEVLSGDNPDGLQLVAEGSSDVALPVTIDFAGIFDVAEAVRGEDIIGFGLKGGFGFDTDIGPVDVLYEEEGDFPALRTPTIALGDLRIQQWNDQDVDFDLDIQVDNDHGSTLDFSNLDFDLSFAGVRVGQGNVASVGSVEGATTKTMTIPISVDYEDAYEAMEAAWNGERVSVGLDADVDVATPFGIVPLNVDESGRVEVRDESD